MNLKFRKGLTAFLALSMTASLAVGASAAESAAPDYTKYTPGVTTEADANSPTGYTSTFVYAEEDSYDGLTGDPVKVELYSDCFYLFDPAQGAPGVIDASLAYTPDQYKPGFAPAGGDGNTTYYVEMTEFEDGMWGAQLPLSSGMFVYNFRVTDAEGNQVGRLDDPSNPTLTNTATGIHSLSSLVYIPYNAEKMGDGQWADRSVELPQADEAKRGTVETVAYKGADGTDHGLAVYLPAGYDADREEPYNVLYLSHGTSGDIYGDELRWMHEGAVANIMDNLIAQGKVEPFVVVTMNNQQFGLDDNGGHSGPNWQYTDIETDQFDYIMPFVEKNYNVSAEAAGRAYAGLSMGGSTTSNMLMYHPEDFAYYGIWSYANVDREYGDVDGINSKAVQDKLAALETKPNIMLAYGTWDFGLPVVQEFGDYLDQIGLDYMELEVPAAHDWENWQMTYAYAAENFFWKDSGEDGSALPFQDVKSGDWFYDAASYVYENGLMAGVSDTAFGPDATTTRGMIVTILYSLEGKPSMENENLGDPFADVDAGDWYGTAVYWARLNNIVSGYSDSQFGPNDPITREQLALILYGYANYKGYDTTQAGMAIREYSDYEDISDYAVEAMTWALNAGLISGTSDTTLTPNGPATRAQVAVILANFCENIAK